MNELEKLWKVLKRDSYTDKSFSEFQVAWEDDAYQTKVHDVVLRDKLTDKDVKTFKETYAATTPTTPTTEPSADLESEDTSFEIPQVTMEDLPPAERAFVYPSFEQPPMDQGPSGTNYITTDEEIRNGFKS